MFHDGERPVSEMLSTTDTASGWVLRYSNKQTCVEIGGSEEFVCGLWDKLYQARISIGIVTKKTDDDGTWETYIGPRENVPARDLTPKPVAFDPDWKIGPPWWTTTRSHPAF